MELAAGNIEIGLRWLQGFVASYHDTRTPSLLAAVARSEWSEVCRILAMMVA